VNDGAPMWFLKLGRRFVFVAALVAAVSALAPRARAASNEDPEELIKEGVKLRRKGEDARAEGYFRRAYQIAATPRSAAQLGLVELALHEYFEAETHLGLALDEQDAWVTVHKQAIESSRAAARAHLVRVEAAPVPPGTTFSAQGAAAKSVPGDGVVWLTARTATTLRFEAPGRKAAVIQVEGAEGETHHLTLDMPALEAPPPPVARAPEPASNGGSETPPTTTPEPAPPSEAPGSRSGPRGAALRIAGISVGAVGLVAGVVGVILIAQGNAKVDKIETTKTYDPSNGNYQTLQNAGAGLLIGGAVAVAGGVALYLVGRHAGTEPAAGAATSVSFAPGAGGGILSWQGRF
jgi:hypothetical protein